MRGSTMAGVLLSGVLVAGAAGAQTIYRWVDSQGEVHYTDDPAAIPPKQRAGAKVTQGDPLSELVHSEGGGRAERTPPAPRAERPEPPDAEQERTWRAAFAKARQHVASLQGQLARDRKALEDPASSGMPVARQVHGGVRPSAEYEALKTRIAQTERELEQARERLADLERRAAEALVPEEWRR